MPFKSNTRILRMTRRQGVIYKNPALNTYSEDHQDDTQGVISATGDNHKNWRLLIARGLNATTSMDATAYYAKFIPGEINCFYTDASPKVESFVEGRLSNKNTLHTTGPSAVEATNLAKTRFVRKALDLQRKFQGGVFLGELRETLSLLSSPAKGLRAYVTEYRRGLKKGLRGIKGSRAKRHKVITEAAANQWLEFSFGVKPLVKDIEDATRALETMFYGNYEERKFITSGGETEEPWSTGGPTLQQIGDALWYNNRRQYNRSECKFYGVIKGQPVVPMLPDAHLFGLGWQDIAPTIWELIPYSFLIDYFTNIGDLITAWSHCSTLMRWYSQTTVKSRILEQWSTKYTYSQNSLNVRKMSGQPNFSPWSRRVAVLDIERIPQGPSLVPTIEFDIPGFSTKWINIGALFASKNADRAFMRR